MENKRIYPTREILTRLLQVMRHLLPFIGLAVLFAVLGFVTTLAIPSLLIILGFSALKNQAPSAWYVLLLIGLALTRGLFRYGEHYFGHYVAFHSLADLRKLIFAKLRRLAPAKLDRQDRGKLLKMIGEDIEALEIFFAHTLAPICTGILSALLIAIYFAGFSLWFTLIALTTYLLLAVALPRKFALDLEHFLQEQHQRRTSYISFFLESLKAMGDLVQFGKVQERFEFLSQKSQQVNQLERQIAQKQFLQQALTFLVVGMAVMLFALTAFYQIQKGQLLLERAVLALVAFSSSFAPFLELGRLPLGFKRAMNAGSNVFGLLDEKEPTQTGQASTVSLEQISVEDIHFVYDDRNVPIFEHLSAHFEKGKIIGLVGSSGCGKSTLMKLLMRWYDPQAGRIIFTGQDSRDIDRQHLQASFAYVPQTAHLFHQSSRENLLLGKSGISDEAIWDLAAKCRLKERLEGLPEGLDTIVDGERDFSAGERQRLELMRALLKKANCYIFDEPTSNLDSLNEAAFLSIVKEECQGMVFLISHRLSTVAFADEVYELTPSQLKRIR